MFAPPAGQLGDDPAVAPGPVLRRAAVPRDDHRPGRGRRPEHPAGRRRPAVRARGRDLTGEVARPRARPPDRSTCRRGAGRSRSSTSPAGCSTIEAACCGRRAGSRSSARRRTRPGPRSASSATSSTRATTACRSTRTSARSMGVPAFPTLAEAVAATGPFDIVDVFRRPELCLPHAREAVAVGARCLWLQLGVVTGRRRGSPTTAARGRDGPLHGIEHRAGQVAVRPLQRSPARLRRQVPGPQRMRKPRRARARRRRSRSRRRSGPGGGGSPSPPTRRSCRRRGRRRASARSARRWRPAP